MVRAADVRPGTRVRSSDGKDLGIVKDVALDCFKVGRSILPDYWVSKMYVDNIVDGFVQMRLTKQAIEYARVDPPPGLK